jgi:hypothetical protein
MLMNCVHVNKTYLLFSISGHTISEARRQAVDFSVPIFWEDKSILIKNPDADVNYFTYLLPLRNKDIFVG